MKIKAEESYKHDPQFHRMGAEMVDNLLQNLPGLVYRCLYDQQWTMKYISDGCLTLTGYLPAELLDNAVLSYNDLILPEDREYVGSEITQAVTGDKPFTLNYRILTEEGSIRWVWEQGRAVYKDGIPCYLDGYITDMTEYKSLQQELMDTAKKMWQLNVMKDRLFDIIAHDMRNPVYAIISLVDFMTENLDRLPIKDIKEMMKQVQLSVRSTHDILENLLQWVQIQTGNYYVHNEQIDVNHLIRNLIDQHEQFAEERGVNVVFNQFRPVGLFCDPVLVTSILRNLLTNAIKFTPMDGCVTLYARRTATGVYLSVSDTGIGITKRNHKSIFELGWVEYNSKLSKEHGSGIGLVVVKDALNLISGDIQVQSKLGKGSSFIVNIPDQPQGTGSGSGDALLYEPDSDIRH